MSKIIYQQQTNNKFQITINMFTFTICKYNILAAYTQPFPTNINIEHYKIHSNLGLVGPLINQLLMLVFLFKINLGILCPSD